MKTKRRSFLLGSIAATTAGAVGVATAGTSDEVGREMERRLKFLSPPQGTPPDLEASPSPEIENPFTEPLFVPETARPLIDMTGDAWTQLNDAEWWTEFAKKFNEAAQHLLDKERIDIGDLPVPDAHQRFYDFRPQKFFLVREREFAWRYHTDYCEGQEACLDAAHGPCGGSARSYAYYLNDELLHKDDSAARKGVSWTWGFENIWLDDTHGRAKRVCRVAGSPGPTYKANYGEPIMVRRINGLPEIGANPNGHSKLQFALPSTTTHLHNAHTASESDGFPNDWINPGEYWDHHYGNFPSGYDDREKLATLWYHDHRMDFTAANVYAGLDGFYFLYDEKDADFPEEGQTDEEITAGAQTQAEATGRLQAAQANRQAWQQSWKLPAGNFDVPLILHDLYFQPDETDTPQLAFDGFNTDGILGDRFTVNRIIQPKLMVQNRKYRFRLLNGGPSRFYELCLYTENGKLLDADNPDEPDKPFIIITGDGNFQPSPVLAEAIYIGVAQRVDVIVDFSRFAPGNKVYLVNRLEQTNGRGPTERRLTPAGETAGDVEAFLDANAVMMFEVDERTMDDLSRFPLQFRDLPPVDLSEVKRERVFEFDYDGGLWTINGKTFDPNRIDAGIEQDSAEIWTFRNTGNSWHHPIHSHFTEFIILEINNVPHYQSLVQTGQIDEKVDRKERGALVSGRQLRAKTEKLQESFKELEDPSRTQETGRKRKTYNWQQLPEVSRTESAAKRIEEVLNVKLEAAKKFLASFAKLSDEQKTNILNGNYDLIRIDTHERYKEWAEILDALGLGAVLLDGPFMGGPRRDVALILPNWEVKVFMRWKDFVGKHVMHCHNVVHEDHAMMIRWEILPKGKGFDTPHESPEVAQVGEEVETEAIPHVEAHPARAVVAEDDGQ